MGEVVVGGIRALERGHGSSRGEHGDPNSCASLVLENHCAKDHHISERDA